MSNKKHTFKGIFLERKLYLSKAFESLSGNEIKVLLRFYKKRKLVKQGKRGNERWIVTNNGKIVYPYSEAQKQKLSSRQFAKAIDSLQAKGFIDATHWGSGGRKGDMSTFIIDNRWEHYKTSAFKLPKNPRIKDCRQGRSGYSNNKKANLTG